ncbi:universal stress protein [Chelativorans sp. M5D2P16]|uniref:universal stress protein n=1 Tax=Chelativorans sp. M5D2P16 TaxID=3095678 RepID=UPI002ACAB3EA|nr:universal stress protein [Chelativorans sp. M5D2P16]MDZ5696818.1 universal stress protein [Chelativorans sp. M5D2P16]
MTYRTLLAILQSEADAPRVLDFALPFAARHESHLIGLHAEALPVAMITPMGAPAMNLTHEAQGEADSRQAELRALFDERAQSEGVSAEWRGYENVSGDSAVSGIESARAADLAIAQQNDPDADARMVADVEALIFESGRPVLLIPYTWSGRSAPFKKVILAWNGSREAARAVFDALPLMKEAGDVEVLTVDPSDTLQQDAGMAGAAIAATLARHGIDVTVRTEQSAGLSHGDVIANRLADTGADLLVMGAYGRSRASEFIFGGVTRSMLQSMTAPVLMSR